MTNASVSSNVNFNDSVDYRRLVIDQDLYSKLLALMIEESTTMSPELYAEYLASFTPQEMRDRIRLFIHRLVILRSRGRAD